METIPERPIPIVERVLAEKSLKHFVLQAWQILEPRNPIIWNWHLDAICNHLEAVTNTYIIRSGLAGQEINGYHYDADYNLPFINYLLINMPPRHMKSLLVSVFWPVWEWGPKNLPDLRYLFTSYAQPLSTRDSLKRRRVIESSWYQERWGGRFNLTTDQNTKMRFDNDRTGLMIATSVTGIGTGEGGQRVIMDDAHNVLEVESDPKRQKVLSVWDDTLSSRVNDITVGAYIGVMQRTHHKDLSGHLLDRRDRGDIPHLVHLCLPARYEKDHPHPTKSPLKMFDPRKEEGEPLDKRRWPAESLRVLEGSMTAWARAGQLQQRPSPRGGSIVKAGFIKVVENYNHRMVRKMVRFWDKAATEDKSASTTVSVLMAFMREDNPDYGVIVLDVIGGQWNVGERDTRMRQTAEMDGVEVEQVVEQEPGSGGKESAQNSVKKVFFGYKCSMDRPTGAKEVRLEPFASQVENHNVAMLKAVWNRTYIEKLESCVVGGVTDYGDATSGAFNWGSGLTGKGRSKIRLGVI